MTNSRDDVEYSAARAVLLAYRAVLWPENDSPPRFRIGNDQTPGAIGPAVHALAAIPKPARCTAAVQEGCIQITCTPMSPHDSREWNDWISLGSGDPTPLSAKFGTGARDPVFLFRGASEVMAVSAEVLEHFRRAYEMVEISCFVTHAPSELRAEGVDAVVDFDGPVDVASGIV